MTNERAIELLNRISDSQFDGPHGDERREALEMAVRALFSQQIVNDSQGLVNDCISRKMAIDAVNRINRTDNWKTAMIWALTALPSAQSQQKKGKWIWWYEETVTEYATEYTPHCKCSECGRECAPSVATYSNFCRNCGADMRGGQE